MDWVNVGLGAGGFAAVVSLVLTLIAKPVGHMLRRMIEQTVHGAIDALKRDLDRRFDANDGETRSATSAIGDVQQTVASIRATVYPNGGASLADKVQRIDVGMGELRGAFQQHVRDHH